MCTVEQIRQLYSGLLFTLCSESSGPAIGVCTLQNHPGWTGKRSWGEKCFQSNPEWPPSSYLISKRSFLVSLRPLTGPQFSLLSFIIHKLLHTLSPDLPVFTHSPLVILLAWLSLASAFQGAGTQFLLFFSI